MKSVKFELTDDFDLVFSGNCQDIKDFSSTQQDLIERGIHNLLCKLIKQGILPEKGDGFWVTLAKPVYNEETSVFVTIKKEEDWIEFNFEYNGRLSIAYVDLSRINITI
jgi:hypothetical protein